MRRPLFPLLLLACFAVSARSAAAEPAKPAPLPAPAKPSSEAPAAAAPGFASPFGPGWDPLKPPPTDPKTTGRGIVSAKFVAAGAADVEELREEHNGGKPLYYGVVVDVVIAAGSTTAVLGAKSVTAVPKKGSARPLLAACAPTMEDSALLWQGSGGKLGAWHVAIGGGTWFCGGRTGRMAVRLGDGGMRISSKKESEWRGPLVLLFGADGEAPTRVTLPGAKVEWKADDMNDGAAGNVRGAARPPAGEGSDKAH